MLAMVVSDDAGSLMPRGALESIASVLAPTLRRTCLGWCGPL